MFDFLRAIILEIDQHAPSARFRDDPVERYDHDAGIKGLLDGAIQRIR